MANPIVRAIFPNLTAARAKPTVRCPDCACWMVPFTCQDAIIDKCPRCQGIWFDAREIGIFRETLRDYDLSTLEVHKPDVDAGSESISACPRCREVLSAFQYSYNSQVRLKRCDRCHGIWSPFRETLNFIELAKISQLIEPDVRALGVELSKYQERIEFWRWVQGVGTFFQVRIQPFQRLSSLPFALLTPLPKGKIFDAWPWCSAIFLAWNAACALSNHHVPAFLGIAAMLVLFGARIEKEIGWLQYLPLYLLGVVAPFLVAYFADPGAPPRFDGAGSGVSAVLGAYFFLHPTARLKTRILGYVLDTPAWLYLAAWFLWTPLGEIGTGGHLAAFLLGLAYGAACARQRP